MPIYEYQCSQCHHVFEEWLKASEMTEGQTCPQCGGEAHHILSQTSFVLKGGGWYVDDYGYRKGIKEGADTTSSTSGEAATASEKSAEATTDTQQAAPSKKSETKADAQQAPATPKPAATTDKAAPAA